MNFNLCYYQTCRKKVEYIAKDGMGYCSKHTLQIVENEGMNEIWPHYHFSIEKDLILKERRDKEEAKKRAAKEFFRNVEKDRSYHKIVRKK